MILTGIRLTNWKRFRGEFELELGSGAYAIVAEDEEDPDRSNWLGKSAVPQAVRFGLWGKADSDDGTLDGLISHGELELGVDLEFDNGVFISRTKRRGQSLQSRVVVPMPDGEWEATQAGAQEQIQQLLCLSERDFESGVFIGQKQARMFIESDPAFRTQLVNGWIKLGPLEVAASYASRKVDALVAEDAKQRLILDQAAGFARRELGDVLAELGDLPETSAMLERLVVELEVDMALQDRELNEAREAWRAAQAGAEQRALAIVEAQQAKRHKEAQGELKEAKAQAKGQTVAPTKSIEEELHDASACVVVARNQVTEREELVGGNFDGVCPITRKDCPVRDEVVEEVKGSRELLDEARDALASASSRESASREKLFQIRAKNQRAERAIEKQRRLEAEIEKLRPAAERHKQRGTTQVVEEPPEPSDRNLVMAEKALERAREVEVSFEKATRRREELASELMAWRAAVAILGRQGAQRRISGAILAKVEEGANSLLTRAGAGISVKAEWGRPTQQLEDQCWACGSPFPKSRKVKICEACGEQRGLRTDGKLHIVTSSVSGATEDLGGVAFQLSAAAWLRRRRGSPFGSVFLDEPFGALDAHNRRGLAQALVRIVDLGFEQAFVIAHDRSTLDAMPSRIQVVGRGKWSEVRVA